MAYSRSVIFALSVLGVIPKGVDDNLLAAFRQFWRKFRFRLEAVIGCMRGLELFMPRFFFFQKFVDFCHAWKKP